jgi:hypothetical protein
VAWMRGKPGENRHSMAFDSESLGKTMAEETCSGTDTSHNERFIVTSKTLDKGAVVLSSLDIEYVMSDGRSQAIGYLYNRDVAAQNVWTNNNTSLYEVDRRLHIKGRIIDLAKRNPTNDIVVLDWGCGTGRALIELSELLKAENISNVVLVGFSDVYYNCWRSAPYGITFVLDREKYLIKVLLPISCRKPGIFSA